MTRAACAVIAIVALAIAMVPPGASSQAQSRSEAVHHRHLRVDAPWGSERVLVMFPRLGGGREVPRDHEKTMLVVSDRAGKDRAGAPIWRGEARAPEGRPGLDHDLDTILGRVRPFVAKGFSD